MVAPTQFLHHRRWPSSLLDGLGTSDNPANPFPAGLLFSKLPGSLTLRPVDLFALLDGSDQTLRPANEDFYFRASDGLVARTVAGYNYGGNWVSSTGRTFTR